MNILQTITIGGAIGIALTTSALAADFTVAAPVISASPIFRQVSVPHQECWIENVTVQVQQARSNAGAIIGGISGGIIGNQVGDGRGRAAATVAGVIAGTIFGERMDNSPQPPQYAVQQVQRCRMANNLRQELSGYNVTYRYEGRDVTVMLPYDPGSTVMIGVGVM